MALASPKVASARKIWLGREREIGELEAGLEDLRAGRGGLFLVTGEPGIGKTRLADEFARSVAARGLAVHWGRAWEAGGAPSFWPFIQVLRSMCRGLDADVLAERIGMRGPALAELMPELRERIPALVPKAQHVTRERFQLFDAVASFVHAVAAGAPQLVVLDDLHAADPSSLLLLQFLVRDLRSAPLLFVGTYREAEARLTPEIASTLVQIEREAVMLPLRRLDRSEVADFVTQATGAAPTEEHVDEMHQRTEGNPLFLRELLQLRGHGRQADGIREVVRARLSLLTPGVRHALEAAAVLGREFAVEPLAALAETSELDVRGWMSPAADAGIVEALQQPPRWRFTHVLLREGLYEDLPAARRAALHRAAAAAVLQRDGEPALAELAHHLLLAIPAASVGEAAEAALRAAERASELLAFEDASTLLAYTSKLLDGVAGEERRHFEVLLGLGVARIRAGHVKAGKETCRRAADLARRVADGELLARAVLGSACEYVWGVRDLALIALLEEALAALPAGDGAWRARCMAQLAAERQPEPDTERPVELARSAVAMARRVSDVDTLRFTLTNAGIAMLGCGKIEERYALNQECLRLALAGDDKLVALRTHALLQADCFALGDPAGASAHLRGYDDLLQLRHSSYRWMSLCLRVTPALWEARFDDAERWCREAMDIHREDEGSGAEMVAFPLGFCRAAERYDDLPGIEARMRTALGSAQQELGSCISEMLIAQLHGRGDRRRAAAQLATAQAHPLFAEIKEASWLALLVEPCHLVGDVALATHLYGAVLPRAQQFFWCGPLGVYCEPPYSRQLGLLAQTLGRLDEAVAHLTDAESRVVQSGMRSHLARLRYELAGVLLARHGPGDRERAATLLEEALTLAEELGQTGLLPLLAARVEQAQRPEVAGEPGVSIAPSASTFTLRREGDYWTIVCGARSLRLRDSRGMRVLDQLVTNRNEELHVLQLVSDDDTGGRDPGDAGTLLDAGAVQDYRRRLLDLREELDEAERFADAGRIERARGEIDFLTQELARAVGLGGRDRRAGAATERARTAVQKRLRTVIRRIEDELPELGRHLDQTVRTGTFCGYLPEGRRKASYGRRQA